MTEHSKLTGLPKGTVPATPEAVTRVLREKGMKATVLRRQVLELFLEIREPLSHTEILKKLTASGQKVDKVTLYRVLAAFSNARIFHEIQGIDGTVRYCLHQPSKDVCPGNHPHFLCRECGRMLCLNGQPLPRVDVPDGAVIEGKQLLIFGLCPRCAGAAL